MLVDIISSLHKSTKRDYAKRMNSSKPECMVISKEYGFNYWDGDRKYGYGGYKNDGRWKPVAKRLASIYRLNKHSRVLDIGCGKGYLASQLQELTGCHIVGVDNSGYALQYCDVNAFKFDARKDKLYGYYDLILCINVLHNFTLQELKHAIREIALHSIHSYVCMDSYRNERELYNLQCWALTAEQFLRPEEWEFLFNEWGYRGDWEFIFFE